MKLKVKVNKLCESLIKSHSEISDASNRINFTVAWICIRSTCSHDDFDERKQRLQTYCPIRRSCINEKMCGGKKIPQSVVSVRTGQYISPRIY